MILPYISIAATVIPAAARSRGFLRWYLLYDVAMTCALKLAFIHFQQWDEATHRMVWPLYDPIWRIAEPVGMVLAGAATIERTQPRRWPFYALGACAVHVWAANYPQRWPDSWLHAEIHAVAFCCLLFGLALINELGAGLHGSRSSERSACQVPITLPLLQASYARWVPRSVFDSKEPSRAAQICALALLFLGTSAALYPAPWAMWLRPWLMWFQAGCYLLIARPSRLPK